MSDERPSPPQLGLFGDLRRQIVFPTRRHQIDDQFREFHAENPEVWSLFCRFIFEAMNAGHKHFSADAIVHRIRWETSVVTACESKFKINNNYVTCYARSFHATYPEHAGFFRTRERISSRRPPRSKRHEHEVEER
jgi:hypothetical protein